MNRRNRTTVRVAPGVFLALQARDGQLLAELFSDACGEILIASTIATVAADVNADFTGLGIGQLRIAMDHADAERLQRWSIERMAAGQVTA